MSPTLLYTSMIVNILALSVQNRKIFTIIGPYHALRTSLRQRGWIEKLNNSPALGPVPVLLNKWQPVGDKNSGTSFHCLPLEPFKCYVTLFFWKIDTHPPPCNANNIEQFTFVTFFLGNLTPLLPTGLRNACMASYLSVLFSLR